MDKKIILRKAISEALEQLLERADSLQDISVQDILEQCGLSRPTFYRYFSDKYDVINWTYSYYVEELTALFDDAASPPRGDLFLPFVQFFYDRRTFFTKVMDYAGQNSFYDHYFSCFVHWYKTMRFPPAQRAAPLSPEDNYMLLYSAAGITQVLREWLSGGCKEPPAQFCQMIKSNLPPTIRQYIS